MSVDNKIIFSYEKKKIKPLKLNYNQITPKRVNLCKKYFYMDQPKDKINLIKFNNEKNALEQVDNVITKLTRKSNFIFKQPKHFFTFIINIFRIL